MEFPTPRVPGLNPNANRGPGLNTVAIAFTCISFTTIICRGFSRLYTDVEFGLDDWLIVLAAFFSWTFTALGIAAVQMDYLGQNISKTDVPHLESFLKLAYASIVIFPIALTLSKLSLLALYWRIFRMTTGRRPLQIVAIINIAWMISAVIMGVFLCVPVYGFWEFTKPSKCVNYPVMFIANETTTLIFDLFVLLLPVYFISQIQQSLSQRLSISSTFLLGFIATVISAIRLWQLVVALNLPRLHPTYNDTNSQLYGDIELNMWILVASVPALRPLVGKVIRNSRSKDSKSTGSGRTWYKISSFSSLKSRVLSKYSRSYSHGDGRIPLNGIDSTGALSTPLENKSQDPGSWAPSGNDSIEIKPTRPARGIHVQREFNIHQSQDV